MVSTNRQTHKEALKQVTTRYIKACTLNSTDVTEVLLDVIKETIAEGYTKPDSNPSIHYDLVTLAEKFESP